MSSSRLTPSPWSSVTPTYMEEFEERIWSSSSPPPKKKTFPSQNIFFTLWICFPASSDKTTPHLPIWRIMALPVSPSYLTLHFFENLNLFIYNEASKHWPRSWGLRIPITCNFSRAKSFLHINVHFDDCSPLSTSNGTVQRPVPPPPPSRDGTLSRSLSPSPCS